MKEAAVAKRRKTNVDVYCGIIAENNPMKISKNYPDTENSEVDKRMFDADDTSTEMIDTSTKSNPKNDQKIDNEMPLIQ